MSFPCPEEKRQLEREGEIILAMSLGSLGGCRYLLRGSTLGAMGSLLLSLAASLIPAVFATSCCQ